MKKIIPALAMLLISAIVMSTASFAWFSMNQNVVASGMQITAQASGSLVIGPTNTDTAKFDGSSTHKFTTTDNRVSATTYDGTDWKYAAGSDVDPDSGALKTNATLKVLEASVDTDKNGITSYYVDYLVYIGSAGQALTNHKLEAEVTFNAVDATKGLTGQAMSVAFFVLTDETVGAQASDTDWADTWAVVQKDVTTATQTTNFATGTTADNTAAIATYMRAVSNAAKADTANKTYTDVVTLSNSRTIPSASEGNAKSVIPVVMRVYFDGNANDGAATPQYYVNSKVIDSTAFGVTVNFKVTDLGASNTP